MKLFFFFTFSLIFSLQASAFKRHSRKTFFLLTKNTNLIQVLELLEMYPIWGENGSLKQTISLNPQKFYSDNSPSSLPTIINLPGHTIKPSLFYKITKQGELIFTHYALKQIYKKTSQTSAPPIKQSFANKVSALPEKETNPVKQTAFLFGLGLKSSSFDIVNLLNSEKSRISTPTFLNVNIGIQYKKNEDLFFELGLSTDYVSYLDIPAYNIQEERKLLKKIFLKIQTKLSSGLSLNSSIAFEDRHFFLQSGNTFKALVLSAPSADLSLKYSLKFTNSILSSSLGHTYLMPSNNDSIESLSGSVYKFNLTYKKGPGPLFYLEYKEGRQDTNLFKQNFKGLNLGVLYEF